MSMIEWRKRNDALGTVNRGDACESGLCTLCMSDCKGKCETWMSSLVGRKTLYPRNFGESTSGSANVVANGVGYQAVRIHGYAYGAKGISEGQTLDQIVASLGGNGTDLGEHDAQEALGVFAESFEVAEGAIAIGDTDRLLSQQCPLGGVVSQPLKEGCKGIHRC